MGEIFEAISRYEERKVAIYGDERDSEPALTAERMRVLMVGLDLDLQELDDARHAAIKAAVGVYEAALAHVAIGDKNTAMMHTIAGTWIDGVITGILIEQGRDE